MPRKIKTQDKPINPLIPPSIDLDNIPLVDRDYRINEAQCDYDFLELYCSLEDKHVDKTYEIGLWDSKLPHYIFPLTFQAPEFTRRCQECYVPTQRAIISPAGDILFTITAQSIDQIMSPPIVENTTPFSLEALTQIYQKLDFATRAKIFEIFLPENAQFPKKNPPYPSTIFPDHAKQIISMISYILGYYSDQWLDEPILGFLSIFSTDNKPSLAFNFSQFLANSIREQFINFPTEQGSITPLFLFTSSFTISHTDSVLYYRSLMMQEINIH